MDLLNKKLDKITDIWNHYFWEYKCLQKKINFNDAVKTNYYGEILSYFNDTFSLLKLNNLPDFSSNIFHYIGLLQIIYVQQDLMDELLQIFGVQKASLTDKSPNRGIRNELVGHPIKRDKKNELISSVLFSNSISNTNLEYLIYSSTNKFKMKVKNHDPQKIIDDHKIFLNKYFDLVIDKIIVDLKWYKKRLTEFELLLNNSFQFERILTLTLNLFERILKNNHLYTKVILTECFKRKSEHKRYSHVIEIFITELKSGIREVIDNIDDFILFKQKKFINNIETMQVPEIYYSNNIITIKVNEKSSYKKSYSYELGKLHEKSPVFDIAYFRNCFKSHKLILAELDNMDINIDNDLEYYASYEYLSKLILKKDYII